MPTQQNQQSSQYGNKDKSVGGKPQAEKQPQQQDFRNQGSGMRSDSDKR